MFYLIVAPLWWCSGTHARACFCFPEHHKSITIHIVAGYPGCRTASVNKYVRVLVVYGIPNLHTDSLNYLLTYLCLLTLPTINCFYGCTPRDRRSNCHCLRKQYSPRGGSRHKGSARL